MKRKWVHIWCKGCGRLNTGRHLTSACECGRPLMKYAVWDHTEVAPGVKPEMPHSKYPTKGRKTTAETRCVPGKFLRGHVVEDRIIKDGRGELFAVPYCTECRVYDFTRKRQSSNESRAVK